MTERGYELLPGDHESMRRLILGRFEDDVLLRREVETWLDELAHPDEWILRGCMEAVCYCYCDRCRACKKWPHLPKSEQAATERRTRVGCSSRTGSRRRNKSGKRRR